MADFFDQLNQQFQQRAAQGNALDWETYSKMEQAQKQAEQEKKKKGKSNFLTSLIPSGGGIAGAAGGAALGSAILPGAGTIVGALLGGTLGGGAGKVAENAVEGQKDLGQGVGQEALLNGVLGAGPLRLVKGGIDVARGVKAGAGLADAVTQAGTKAVASQGATGALRSAAANKGAQMEARAGGFGVGEKLAGQQPLGFYDSAKVSSVLKSEGIKGGTPESRLKQVEDALSTRGKQIDVHLTANNASLSATEKKTIADKFLKSVEQQPGVDDLTRKKAGEMANNFLNQTSDLKSLVKFRRGLDSQVINFTRNPDTALASKQLAAKTLRDTLSTETGKMAPGIKGLNKSYSDLIDAKGYLTGGSKAVSDMSQNAGGGLIGRAASGDTAQGLKSKGGLALQKLAPSAPNPYGVGSVSSRIAPVGLLSGASQSQDMTGQAAMPPPPTMESMPQQDTQQGAQQTPYSQENLLYDMQRDPQNADKYLSYYQSLDKVFGGSKLNSTQLQQANNATSGLQSLQTISDTLQQNPDAAKLSALPGGSITSSITGTGSYQAAINNAADVIGRLRSGGAINGDEEKRFMSLLPQAFDSPETIQYKLSSLSSLFNSFANPQAAQPDLATALTQQGGYSGQ